MLLEAPFPFDSASSKTAVNIQFTAALLKVASRCNLNCDYCYVYQHADQSWREQPHFMAEATLIRFAERLDEYVRLYGIPEFSVTFHGGEPLLFGADRLTNAVRLIRSRVHAACVLDFSIQTNGTLLSEDMLDQLERVGILISLSIDGDRTAHDRHRLDHGGKSTFDLTHAAIQRLLLRSSSCFRGVIAVIDPAVSPRQLFEFFAPLNLPRLDLLLPDATHIRQPPGRAEKRDLYLNWLNEAFQIWFQEFPSIPLRWFDAVLASRLGVPSSTDAMGMGSVSLIVIDTDGSYTDHDVFKITRSHGPALNCHLESSSFDEVSRHPGVQDHARRLTLDGLAHECRTCPVVEACGGGSVMHRWHPTRQLDAPTVYCREMFGLLETSSILLRKEMESLNPPSATDTFPITGDRLLKACIQWRCETEKRADECANFSKFVRGGASAAAILLWQKHGQGNTWPNSEQKSIAKKWLGSVAVQSTDAWLVAPFLDSIRVLDSKSEAVKTGLELLDLAEEILRQFDPTLPAAFSALISDIVFVESKVEQVDQIFSFSDDSAPNVLYVAPYINNRPLSPDDFADSLLHEFQHHVLYHLERKGGFLFDNVFPHFPAPWRTGLRPAAGFFHGTFVFARLARFWNSLANTKTEYLCLEKARANADKFRKQAAYGIASLRQFALLTPRGSVMLECLEHSLESPMSRLPPPGAST